MTETNDDWRKHLLESDKQIEELLASSRRIAVLGIKVEPHKPAHYVPAYARKAGYEIVPVPVYYRETTEILGEPVFRKIADVPGEVDIVNVFRKPADIPAHVDDIIAKQPRAVWFQMGITNDEAAEKLARAGIDVVQDRCMMVELRRIGK
ncbi:MAG: CoA-binding protein [Gemmatimonadaceae bacterium]|nr:CoA-binding protein [Gemmatimonadaceae bacterium]